MKFLVGFVVLALIGKATAVPLSRRAPYFPTPVFSLVKQSSGESIETDDLVEQEQDEFQNESSSEEAAVVIPLKFSRNQPGRIFDDKKQNDNYSGSGEVEEMRLRDDDSEEEEDNKDEGNGEDVDTDVQYSPIFPVSTWPESSYGSRRRSSFPSIFQARNVYF